MPQCQPIYSALRSTASPFECPPGQVTNRKSQFHRVDFTIYSSISRRWFCPQLPLRETATVLWEFDLYQQSGPIVTFPRISATTMAPVCIQCASANRGGDDLCRSGGVR